VSMVGEGDTSRGMQLSAVVKLSSEVSSQKMILSGEPGFYNFLKRRRVWRLELGLTSKGRELRPS